MSTANNSLLDTFGRACFPKIAKIVLKNDEKGKFMIFKNFYFFLKIKKTVKNDQFYLFYKSRSSKIMQKIK